MSGSNIANSFLSKTEIFEGKKLKKKKKDGSFNDRFENEPSLRNLTQFVSELHHADNAPTTSCHSQTLLKTE